MDRDRFSNLDWCKQILSRSYRCFQIRKLENICSHHKTGLICKCIVARACWGHYTDLRPGSWAKGGSTKATSEETRAPRDDFAVRSLATNATSPSNFVEDRLANVIKEPELDGWNLYLGDWGYNTQKDREEAASIPRICILELSEFSKNLK